MLERRQGSSGQHLEVLDDVRDDAIHVRVAYLAVAGSPAVILRATHEDLAANAVAGQGVACIGEMRSERSYSETAVGGERLESQEWVEFRAHHHPLRHDAPDVG